ncbi:hypothetical protein T484DRAFT_1906320, partial [Baffinella frigidus]
MQETWIRAALLLAACAAPLSGTLPRAELPASSVQTDRGGGWGSQGGQLDAVEQGEARAEGIRRARNKKRRGDGWDSDSANDAAVEALHVPGLGCVRGDELPPSKRRDKREGKREEPSEIGGGGWAAMAAAGTDLRGNLDFDEIVPAAADPAQKRSSRQSRGIKKKEDPGDTKPARQKGEEGAKGEGEKKNLLEGGAGTREGGVKEGAGGKGGGSGKLEKGATADAEGDEDEEGLDLGGKEPVHAGKVKEVSRLMTDEVKRLLRRRRDHYTPGAMLLHKALSRVTNAFDLLAVLSVRMIPLELQDYRKTWEDPMPFFDYRERFREDKVAQLLGHLQPASLVMLIRKLAQLDPLESFAKMRQLGVVLWYALDKLSVRAHTPAQHLQPDALASMFTALAALRHVPNCGVQVARHLHTPVAHFRWRRFTPLWVTPGEVVDEGSIAPGEQPNTTMAQLPGAWEVEKEWGGDAGGERGCLDRLSEEVEEGVTLAGLTDKQCALIIRVEEGVPLAGLTDKQCAQSICVEEGVPLAGLTDKQCAQSICVEEGVTLAGLTDKQCAQIICDIAHVLASDPRDPRRGRRAPLLPSTRRALAVLVKRLEEDEALVGFDARTLARLLDSLAALSAPDPARSR